MIGKMLGYCELTTPVNKDSLTHDFGLSNIQVMKQM